VTSWEDRITISGPVYNMNGDLFAEDATELWSGTAQSTPAFDESGTPAGQNDLVWTGSVDDNCQNWSTMVFDDAGAFGVPTDETLWLDAAQTFQCGLSLHLYCISQP
jgi:hypothetical protein